MPEDTQTIQRYEPFNRTETILRALCALYIVLLIIEGGLRKWVLPGFSDILLLIRDPVVLAAYVIAFHHKRFPLNRFVISGFVLTAFWCIFTIISGHGNLFVTVFGARANFLHIPMIFIMGSVFYRSDLIKIGYWWLLATIAMSTLIVLQYSSPQDAFVNLSVGGGEGGGFSGARGRFRPPGTFSFIVGVVWFYTISTAFLIAAFMQHKHYPKWLILSSAIAILISIPVSISRSLLLASLLTLLVGLVSSSFQKKAFARYARLLLFAIIGLLIADQFEIFRDARKTFMDRWNTANEHSETGFQGAVVMRILNEFIGPFNNSEDIPFFGYGIGAGTQVGSKTLTGERSFFLGESEWKRSTGEGGIIFGSLFIFWRIWFTVALAKYALVAFRSGNGLGLILLSTVAFNLLVGQWGQTTIQGFTIVASGMTIMAMRQRKVVAVEKTDESPS